MTGEGKRTGRLGTAVCAVLLAAGCLLAAYGVWFAYTSLPANGDWGPEEAAAARHAAVFALVLSAVLGLLAMVFVKAEWLSRHWYAAPALPALAALLRLTLLTP
ncbi:hypothetical protein [Streptomyces bambusae]|uniref:hypothetical protein n=1 Tax=Streptomyces bambusae TaxID=1550616 RepID=UPI001CA48FF8|nr:hypothetical protein [Streptomyces bambusae]